MSDGVWNMVIQLWASEIFRLLVIVGIGWLLWNVRTEVKRLKRSFDNHVVDESKTFTELRKDIQTIKGNDLEHLSADLSAVAKQVETVGGKLDNLIMHLMDKA